MKLKIKQLLHEADQFAQPCSIGYNGRQSHPSMPGGCTSAFYIAFLVYYLSWRYQLFNNHQRDEYMAASMQSSLLEREPLYLKNSTINFNVIVHDKDYDNADNPYGELRVVLYNNMNGTSEQQFVPLKRNCSNAFSEDNVWASTAHTYCPDFSDEHILKNDYYAKESSWMRLILYSCDP